MHPSDPLYAQQWHFSRLGNIEKIWDEFSGAGIHVGAYDTGIDLAHPDLAANYDPSREVVIDGVKLSGGVNIPATQFGSPPAHGTAVMGLIIAGANNGTGGTGVAWGAGLTSVNIGDTTSPIYLHSADLTDFLAAFHQMTNFDVANHSWNFTGSDYDPLSNLYGIGGYSRVNTEYDYVSANGRGGLGTIVIQGVANSNVDGQLSGLNVSRFTITVAGTQNDGFASDFSNYGACVLVTAPSTNIVTTDISGSEGANPGDYLDAAHNAASPPNGAAGTSLSGPIVSGVAALMLQANPNLGWRDVQNIIAASATHTGSVIGAVTPGINENSNWFLNDAANWNGGGMHFSNDYGYGALNAYSAVRMAEAWSLFAPAQTSANEKAWYNEDDTDRVIPDNGTLQFAVPLFPSPGIDIEHVELRVNLTHTDFRQLRIFLVSPSGTEMQLLDGSGGTDATADGVFNWTYGGEALRGEDASGNWTVRIVDSAAGETGTLLWYNLVVFGAAASANDVYHYTDEFLAMAALSGQGGRAVLSDTNDGTDWIDAAAVTGNVALDLAGGATVNGASWFTIAGGTIENAVTGDGNDSIIGNGAANLLYGMRGDDILFGAGGDDTIDGSQGNDTARFSGARAQYQIYRLANGDLRIADLRAGSPDGTDTVHAIEHVAFADVTVAANAAIPPHDFNGDGKSDLLWQNLDGTPAIWSLDGTSLNFGANAGFNPGAAWHEIGSGDFNRDGKADILWQNDDGTPAAWLMDGTSILSGANVGFNPGAAWQVQAAADFNGDGKSDILWQNADGTPAIWQMDGLSVTSGANVGFNPGAAWHVIGAADFDGDGKADILWQNSNGQAAIWLMNGQSLIAGSDVGFNPGAAWHVQAAADFNGDGKADILWQNADGTPAIWLMDGLSLISGANVGFNPGASWQVHGAGDFNGDGKADIAWQNTDGTPAVWLMDGYNLVSGSNVGSNPGPAWHEIPPHEFLA
jgi:subtilisin-like proprotein convertase family protein